MPQQQYRSTKLINRISSRISTNIRSISSSISNTSNTNSTSNISNICTSSSSNRQTFSTSNNRYNTTTNWATQNQSISCPNYRARWPIHQMPSTTVRSSRAPAAAATEVDAWQPLKPIRTHPVWSRATSRYPCPWARWICPFPQSCIPCIVWWPQLRSKRQRAAPSPRRLVCPVWSALARMMVTACRRHRCPPPWPPLEMLPVWVDYPTWAPTWWAMQVHFVPFPTWGAHPVRETKLQCLVLCYLFIYNIFRSAHQFLIHATTSQVQQWEWCPIQSRNPKTPDGDQLNFELRDCRQSCFQFNPCSPKCKIHSIHFQPLECDSLLHRWSPHACILCPGWRCTWRSRALPSVHRKWCWQPPWDARSWAYPISCWHRACSDCGWQVLYWRCSWRPTTAPT